MQTKKLVGLELGTTRINACVYCNGKCEIVDFNALESENLYDFIHYIFLNNADEMSEFISFLDKDSILGRNNLSIIRLLKGNFTETFKAKVKVNDDFIYLTIRDLLSLLFIYIKDKIDRENNCYIDDYIISVPGYLTLKQKKVLQEAAEISKIKVLRVISNSLSATIAYEVSLGKGDSEDGIQSEKNILLIDFGAGGIEISLINSDSGFIEVIGSKGTKKISGEVITERLYNYVCEEIIKIYGIKVERASSPGIRLQKKCEVVKHQLFLANKASIFLDSLVNGIDVEVSVEKSIFIQRISDLLNSMGEMILELLSETKNEIINEILILGDASKTCGFIDLIKSFIDSRRYKSREIKLIQNYNKNSLIPKGAVMQGLLLLKGSNMSSPIKTVIDNEDAIFSNLVFVNVTPYPILLEYNKAFQTIANKFSKLPFNKEMRIDTANLTSNGECGCFKIKLIENTSETKQSGLFADYIEEYNLNITFPCKTILLSININIEGTISLEAFDAETLVKVEMCNNHTESSRVTQQTKDYFNLFFLQHKENLTKKRVKNNLENLQYLFTVFFKNEALRMTFIRILEESNIEESLFDFNNTTCLNKDTLCLIERLIFYPKFLEFISALIRTKDDIKEAYIKQSIESLPIIVNSIKQDLESLDTLYTRPLTSAEYINDVD